MKISRIKHSYAQLSTNPKLPSVTRNGAKTSLDYLHKPARTSRNTNGLMTQRTQARGSRNQKVMFGYQTTKSNLCKVFITQYLARTRRIINPKK